jgi:hypothetical protein
MLIQKFQVIKGAVLHIIDWVHSPNDDIIIANPNFVRGIQSKPGIVIYCAHGTADRSASFKYISEHIVNQLPDTVSSIILVAFKGRMKGKSISHYANQLICKILKNRHENIILMGHSRGGLVAATTAEDLKHKNIKIISVITICSPFKGTPRIVVPFNKLAQSLDEMMPHSDFLHELENKIKQNDVANANSIPYFFISSEDDVICPAEGCSIPSARFKTTTLPNEGHLSIMNSEQLVKILSEYINGTI